MGIGNFKQNGFGFYRYKSGAKYVGNNKDNKSHGHGIFTYTNGSKLSILLEKRRVMELYLFQMETIMWENLKIIKNKD